VPEFPHTAATIIVIGNEKGGSGKTTTALHVVSALLWMGFRVGTLDLDIRQQSFSRYLRNRIRISQQMNITLPMPDHSSFRPIGKDPFPLMNAMKDMCKNNDIVVVDCPGNDGTLVRTAHSYAGIVITPINDSLLDLDVIADLDDKGGYLGPGVYAEMVLGQRRRRLDSWFLPQEWVIVRNRLSQIGDRNKEYLADKLDQLSGVMGFRVTTGLSERVVFRQMFLAGLTVFDLDEPALGMPKTLSHQKAIAEVKGLVLSACSSINTGQTQLSLADGL
jgi:chromosome partitioning protein